MEIHIFLVQVEHVAKDACWLAELGEPMWNGAVRPPWRAGRLAAGCKGDVREGDEGKYQTQEMHYAGRSENNVNRIQYQSRGDYFRSW